MIALALMLSAALWVGIILGATARRGARSTHPLDGPVGMIIAREHSVTDRGPR